MQFRKNIHLGKINKASLKSRRIRPVETDPAIGLYEAASLVHDHLRKRYFLRGDGNGYRRLVERLTVGASLFNGKIAGPVKVTSRAFKKEFTTGLHRQGQGPIEHGDDRGDISA